MEFWISNINWIRNEIQNSCFVLRERVIRIKGYLRALDRLVSGREIPITVFSQ